MATKKKQSPQKVPAYGLTDELVDNLLQGSTSYEEVFGEGGIYRTLTKRLFERMLETEMSHHLGYDKHQKPRDEEPLHTGGNARNGHSSKNVKAAHSEVELSIPRDRQGTFEPRIVPKGSRRLPEIERTIIALYAGGMSTRAIADELYRGYGIEASASFISDVTDSIIDDVEEWRHRPLETLYPVAFFDGFFLKVRENRKVVTKCLYIGLAVDSVGVKQCLGLWIAETESAAFWLDIFTELRNRGLQEILIATTDGRTGFEQALQAAFPQCLHQTCILHLLRHSTAIVLTKDRPMVNSALKAVYTSVNEEQALQAAFPQCLHQTCILHLLRHSTAIVLTKDRPMVNSALKAVYTSVNEEQALQALDRFEKEWGSRYPGVVKAWRNNWSKVIPMFSFMPELRRLVYTNNPLESLNRGLRQAVKTRTIFPNDTAVFKISYLVIQKMEERWRNPIADWPHIFNQLQILFPNKISFT